MVNYSKLILALLLSMQPITSVVAEASNLNGMSPRTQNVLLGTFAVSVASYYGLAQLQRKVAQKNNSSTKNIENGLIQKAYPTLMNTITLAKYTSGVFGALSFCAYVGNAGYSFARTTKA